MLNSNHAQTIFLGLSHGVFHIYLSLPSAIHFVHCSPPRTSLIPEPARRRHRDSLARDASWRNPHFTAVELGGVPLKYQITKPSALLNGSRSNPKLFHSDVNLPQGNKIHVKWHEWWPTFSRHNKKHTWHKVHWFLPSIVAPTVGSRSQKKQFHQHPNMAMEAMAHFFWWLTE